MNRDNNPYTTDYSQPPYQETYASPDDPTVQSRVVHNQKIYEDVAASPYQRIEERDDYVEDPNIQRANTRYWIAAVTYFLLSVLEIILLLRFVFKLLGANQGSSFVQFLYSLSFVFASPFIGIFSNPSFGAGRIFEVSTLVAALVYALAAWGIVSLGKVVFAPILISEQHVTTTRRGHTM